MNQNVVMLKHGKVRCLQLSENCQLFLKHFLSKTFSISPNNLTQAQQWNCTAELLTNPQFNGTQPLRKSTSMKTTAGPYNSSKHYNPLSHLRSQLI